MKLFSIYIVQIFEILALLNDYDNLPSFPLPLQ